MRVYPVLPVLLKQDKQVIWSKWSNCPVLSSLLFPGRFDHDKPQHSIML